MRCLRIELLFIITVFFVSCKTKTFTPVIAKKNVISYTKNQRISDNESYHNWHFKDIEIDTLAGISLTRVYDSILSNKEGEDIIVAIIDMPIEIEHEGVHKYIQINAKEIPRNGIDDDKNGFIDDVHGWNFITNTKGECNEFVSYEYTRILRKYNPIFGNQIKDSTNQIDKNSHEFKLYQKALAKHQLRILETDKHEKNISNFSKWKKESNTFVSKFLDKEKFTLKRLDSLKKEHPENEKLQREIKRSSGFIRYGYTDEYIKTYKYKLEQRRSKLLNVEYFDREIIGDNSEDLNDTNYGSPSFDVNTVLLEHGTKMAGIIAHIGLKKEIRLMPLAVSSFGDEHDKDIALAIRYAVDNGARVINMSFAKEFSLYPEWVLEAIKYAEDRNVLIVSGAANDGKDIDASNADCFPNDHGYNSDLEVSDNFLKVGASGLYIDEKLKSSFSNYGKTEVDLFAPGEKIYSTFPNNKMDIIRGGSSCSTAITSGVAALIYSYYPNLTASEVKHVLMDSGLEFSIEVKTPTEEDKNKKTPFNRLSKSGKILNAYNAMIMADSISRAK